MTAKHIAGTTLAAHTELYPYVMDHIGETDAQLALRAAVIDKEKPQMMGAPDEAQFFAWLLRLIGGKRAIEIGVFRGTTTLAMALALQAHHETTADDAKGCKVVGLDVSDDFALFGKKAWASSGVSNIIDFRVGPASASLAKMLETPGEAGSYDLAFIDADKVGYLGYYEQCLQLLRPGGVVAVDNVLWSGRVLDKASDRDADTTAIIETNNRIKNDPRVNAVMLPTADGVYLCTKLETCRPHKQQ